MPSTRFRHSFVVAAPPSLVYAHLIDPRSYLGLSPLVVEVRDVHGTDYVAVERFRLGPFHWDNPIRVAMRGTTDRQVVSTVASPGNVGLIATVDLLPDGDGTAVTETIELTAPWFLRSFAASQARKVQLHRAAELTRRMALRV
jgi:carbon monoxide dehydrogenase subunit G